MPDRQTREENALDAMNTEVEELRRVAIIDMARDQHGREGEVEIDDNAILSEGEDNGTYVQAWVWVDFNGTQFDKEAEEEDDQD